VTRRVRQSKGGRKPQRITLAEIQQAIAELVEKGLVMDSGLRENGRIVWVRVPPREEKH
jgi:hypothetical protein